MNIEQGVASTQDTVVDGGAGEIEILGFTDLVAQELNCNVSFTPDVTGNLPALVCYSAPTAIAAIAVNQVLTEAKCFQTSTIQSLVHFLNRSLKNSVVLVPIFNFQPVSGRSFH